MNVYFAKITKKKGPIKIGVAKDVKKRVQELQTGCPWELKILLSLPCATKEEAYRLEKELHNKFRTSRMMGEWFSHIIESGIPKALAKDISYIKKPSRTGKKDR